MYFTSFSLDQVELYTKHFEQYGFVIVDNVISEEECERSIKEVWEYLDVSSGGKIKKDEPNTWSNSLWPKEICKNGGFMGKFPYVRRLNPQFSLIAKQIRAWENRQNPNIYNVFANLFKDKKLWVSIDRYGIMRPTKLLSTSKVDNIDDKTNTSEKFQSKLTSNDYIIKDEWKTKPNWLHWDLSPFNYSTSAAGFAYEPFESDEYGGLQVQGLITFTDCQTHNGGFHCVPCFHGSRFFEWRDKNKGEYGSDPSVFKRNFTEVPEDDPMRKEITRIPMRKRSLLIWNSQLPHGNFPNDSEDWRMVQYIKMIPVSEPREFRPFLKHTKQSPESWLPPDFKPSELGAKLFGLVDWDSTK
eukprot:TRINITY_DN16687_c0_g1_i1.p1 TRINITY_DN16687_c0_g1~~TRINITY_DN16687_c0_g1_i1.p1  ORF type:complete len:356 (-),score=52.97 TRINITY_DN16687_c0_g1_i1:62-1129(-)